MPVRYDSGMAGGFSFPIINPQRQFQLFEDFVGAYNIADAESVDITNATSGTVTIDTTTSSHGGCLLFDAGASTAAQGVQMQMDSGIVLDEASDLFFEARVRFATTAGTTLFTDEMFVGLAEEDNTVIASSKLSDIGLVGFTSCSADNTSDLAQPTAGFMSVVGSPAASSTASGSADAVKVNTAANAGVGVDDYVRLALVIRNGEAQAFVNGEKVGSKVSTLPTSLRLKPTFVCQADGSTQGKFLLDYVLVTCSRSSTAL
tara:strand:- start:450 stop:1229 length:780 start_codon:yes stop_codon:yes gene_type:complete